MHIGVSGWSFPEWKGTFYSGVPRARWLQHYATVFDTVEINYTFRRTMSDTTAASWRSKVPERFRFAVKAHQRITHHHRLDTPEDDVPAFTAAVQRLGDRLGPVLFQLPPTFTVDTERLSRTLDVLPDGWQAAFEFRHPSWFADPIYELLEQAGAALVVADTDDLEPVVRITAPFTYVRLRRTAYSEADLRSWAARLGALSAEPWVYVKHEVDAPETALRLRDLVG